MEALWVSFHFHLMVVAGSCLALSSYFHSISLFSFYCELEDQFCYLWRGWFSNSFFIFVFSSRAWFIFLSFFYLRRQPLVNSLPGGREALRFTGSLFFHQPSALALSNFIAGKCCYVSEISFSL